jgi:hypothetical protein
MTHHSSQVSADLIWEIVRTFSLRELSERIEGVAQVEGEIHR